MAEENHNPNGAQPETSVDGLEGFITDQIHRQEVGKHECNLDEKKRNDFIARAVAESRRMNKEIEKSKAKSEKLHSEFSSSLMEQWRNEHASEVLTPQQQDLVQQSHKQ